MAAHLEQFLHAYGYVAVFAIIALENIGLPVPGETILITSAVFAGTTHELNIFAVVMTATVAAFAGSAVGCAIGRYGERRFLHRYGRYLHIDDSDLRLGRYLFGRYGGRVVFAARFVAFLRALAGLLAGINGMQWRRFLLFSGLGAAVWAATFGFGAYLLGDRLEALSGRAALVVGIGVVVAALAGFRFLRRNRTRLQREADRAA